jgi:hypothetical protein
MAIYSAGDPGDGTGNCALGWHWDSIAGACVRDSDGGGETDAIPWSTIVIAGSVIVAVLGGLYIIKPKRQKTYVASTKLP